VVEYSSQDEDEFGYNTFCMVCNHKENSWDMFECVECGGLCHPLCATPGGETVEVTDNRFDCYEYPKCILKQIQSNVRMIQDFRSLVKRPKWVTNQPKKASRVRWDKGAQLLRKAKENFNKDFSTARANGQPNEY
jgi:hypothetical protein